MNLAVRRYFWDADFNKLDLKRHKKYIIERILELGDDAAAKWLFKQFSKDDILDALGRSRKISKKSSNYWRLILNK